MVARKHGDQTIRLRAGERTQKQSVDQRENTDVRTDADSEDRDRDDSENRARKQPAKSVPQVAPEILGDTETLYVATFFLDRLHTPQADECHAARLLRSHAPTDVLLDIQLQVRLQLRVELALDALATEQVRLQLRVELALDALATEQIYQANGGVP